jgi:cysteine-rich repeat protein
MHRGLNQLLAASWVLLAVACGSGSSEPERSVLCGNGNLDPGERCDDGNVSDGDNCDSRCGSVIVGFRLATNACPVLKKLSAFPSVAPLGSEVLLSADASDADGDAIYYDWTGRGGRLRSSLYSSMATYTCGYAGTFIVSVWLFDSGGCAVQATTTIVCE